MHDPAIWRERVLQLAAGPPQQSFVYNQSWKDTYAALRCAQAGKPAPPPHRPIHDAGFFSDALFQPWAFGAMDLDPAWLGRETVPRAPPKLSLADFIATYEEPNRPVILQGEVAAWNAATAWTDDYLCRAAVGQGAAGREGGGKKGAKGKEEPACQRLTSMLITPTPPKPPGTLFSAGQAHMTMADYLHYMAQAGDERPLYIFDKHFVAKAPCLGQDYRRVALRSSSRWCCLCADAANCSIVLTADGSVHPYSVPPYFDESRDMFALLKEKVRVTGRAAGQARCRRPARGQG